MSDGTINGFTKTQVLDWVFRVLLAVTLLMLGIIAWQGRKVIETVDDHEGRITTIEASRDVTDRDVQRRLSNIEVKLDRLLERP